MVNRLTVCHESWPLKGVFAISRGSRTASEVVTVEVTDGVHVGRGEGVPTAHYGETVDGVMGQLEQLRPRIAAGLDRAALQSALSAGAARNALDCAMWDLEAKQGGVRAWHLAGLPEPAPLTTAYTLSLGSPEEMARAMRDAEHRSLIKLKLTGVGDVARVEAVRQAAPGVRIIVDANEAWTPELYGELAPPLEALGVEMIEQPLPAGADGPLAEMHRPVAVCADESCHTSRDVPGLVGRYDMVNVKLDKSGGLTEALRVVGAARDAGLGVMVGCMVGTSLSMAPAILLGWTARFVDLDGPLWLARDRKPGLRFDDGVVHPPPRALWG